METIRGDKEAVRYTAARDGIFVTGLFDSRVSAERAYDTLTLRGYRSDEVDIVMSDETLRRHFGDGGTAEPDANVEKGAGVNAGIGAAVGALAAMFAVAGTSVSVPSPGIIFAGPTADALGAAGADAAPGSALRALAAIGMSEDRAKRYEQEIRAGSILLGVRARDADDAHYLVDEWIANDGQHVERYRRD